MCKSLPSSLSIKLGTFCRPSETQVLLNIYYTPGMLSLQMLSILYVWFWTVLSYDYFVYICSVQHLHSNVATCIYVVRVYFVSPIWPYSHTTYRMRFLNITIFPEYYVCTRYNKYRLVYVYEVSFFLGKVLLFHQFYWGCLFVRYYNFNN